MTSDAKLRDPRCVIDVSRNAVTFATKTPSEHLLCVIRLARSAFVTRH
jgi:hypothetical protein